MAAGRPVVGGVEVVVCVGQMNFVHDIYLSTW